MQKNILVICSDEHNPFMSSYRNHPTVKTPNLDKLAEDGTVFTNAFCTSPVCTPSRMSFITGKYCFDIKSWFMGFPLCDQEMTWGKKLDLAGIESNMLGKLDMCGPYQSAGFTKYKTDCRRPVMEQIPPPTPIALRLKGYTRADKWRHIVNAGIRKEGHVVSENKSKDDYGVYGHDVIVKNWALDYIKEKAEDTSDKPWALYVGLLYPHWPYCCPKEYFDMYYPNVELPKDFRYPNKDLHPILQEFQKGVDFKEISEENLRRVVAAYYGMITCMDDMIGEIIEELKKSDLYEDTDIIYTSDHGESLGEHGLFFKQCSYEGSVGVPLIVKSNDYEKGQVIDTPVSLVDLYPTILDMANIEVEDDRPGQSWLPLMKGEKREDPVVFAEYHGNFLPQDWYMVRDERYKYTHYENRNPSLFDLQNDPGELNDLIKVGGEEVKEIAKIMQEKLSKIVDTDKVSLECKKDFGLISEYGEDYTESITVKELQEMIEKNMFAGANTTIKPVDGKFVGEY